MPVGPGEVEWLHPTTALGLVWDPSMAEVPSFGSIVQELMERALRGPLPPGAQGAILSALASDVEVVHHCGLSPGRLPVLVENNPTVATEVLLRLVASPVMGDYLTALVRMDLSLHSMEVVSRLTTQVELPPEFVHAFIANCIVSCENVSDRYMQNRLVRLVCVFLQNLIQNKIFNVHDLFTEVQSFCIEFSRIREAAGLFRLLKTLE
ncbi:hypothetical protein BU14_2447s0001 [Porphyra umbilicalis]|uniref:CCR4-NOT transcription complex subunit 11 n=1 Tax=Porphyra umbilicalis TaxID=2786 RepID=A0A1X6NJB6_PORUM|nr:hypothetical protein BU14_2447s0001 [Porphyra umbilicalis]|eukprot:OSX68642.1 hypothetical protein BU14_2447s0001 [Porphyra umbilicalis]